MTELETQLTEPTDGLQTPTGSIPVALLRITLGVIVMVTWFDNLGKDLYTGDGLSGLIGWLFDEENGNGSSLGFYESILDSVVVPNAGLFAGLQLVVELVFGLSLLFGIFTRLGSLLAAGFFVSLFLGYFGGEEWIWTYVLLTMAAITVFLGYGGRRLGADQFLHKARGSSPASLLW
ncbi:MAG: DoxX family membrane protein [Actinomycetota bacterium]